MNVGQIALLEEPKLEFRYGQITSDPHVGLGLFGPSDADEPAHPRAISYAVIGPEPGPTVLARFFEDVRRPVVSCAYGDPSRIAKEQVLWPPFPGVEAVFAVDWPSGPGWIGTIDRKRVLAALKDLDPYKRAYDVCNAYLEAIRIAVDRDENYSVILCIVPEEVWLACRPQSRVTEGLGRRPTKQEQEVRRLQQSLFGEYEPAQYELSVDFRRQLKARAMEFSVPIQLVRESTLGLEISGSKTRGLTPASDRAWNLLTTLYYKSGGKPWKLASAREGVCYVGLAFRRSEISKDGRTACCAAQMFLDTGDGVVFRGEFGPWYSPLSEEYHLSSDAARELLGGVLQVYREQGGKALKEVFLHSRSTISREEYEGYCAACPEGTKVVAVRVRRDRETRLYRNGKWPVIRGTVWRTGEEAIHLWSSGFKATLMTYDGWETPWPLRVEVEHGDADIEQVAMDIFGLTKLNYNACKLGDSWPVTVKFSDAVGEILITNPNLKFRRPNFKFYI